MKRTRPRTPAPVLPCSYGCGRNAVGTLNVSWIPWVDAERQYRDRSMSVYLPSCWECATGNVQISVNIPRKD
ncbi:MAG TPA: hypothetical protein VF420_13230 [Casimicrobiaceae bacterium]